MKKVEKIKIVEAGRDCTAEELNQISGGTGCNKYNNCGWFSYESCTSVAYGYESDGSGGTCGAGYSYSSCGIFAYTSCGSGKSYNY